jgi:hypothetical protein
MVRALLSGAKTQTRRVVKFDHPLDVWDAEGYHTITPDSIVKVPWTATNIPSVIPCKFGQIGDQLWVRETWWYDDEDNSIIYRADPDSDVVDVNKHESGLAKYNWRPSIFMPRAASRMTLEVTGVRVERLNDISRGDAMAEGCTFPNMSQGDDPRQWYTDLWTQINGAGSWSLNPWVWVIDFRRVEA